MSPIQNGAVSAANLTAVQTSPNIIQLENNTAAAWAQMKNAAAAAGVALNVAFPVGGYRSLAVQQDMSAHPGNYNIAPGVVLAAPGSSTHGYGTCVDVGTAAGNDWAAAHSGAYGFVRDRLQYAGEANHYHYTGAVASGTGQIHQVAVYSGSWADNSTGIAANATAISAANMGGTWPYIMYVQDGMLWELVGTTNGWVPGNTGVSLSSSASISAVNMGGTQPQVMAVDQSMLWQIWPSPTGWQKAWTGLSTAGQISSVNSGTGWPNSMILNGTSLQQAWANSTTGWQLASTGISVNGSIAAANLGGPWPQVMAIDGGYIGQIWADSTGWHKLGNGYTANGRISAIGSPGDSFPQAIVTDNGLLSQVAVVGNQWQKMGIGANGVVFSSSDIFAAVNMGGGWPQVIKI